MDPNDDIYDVSQFTYEGDFNEQVLEILQCIRLTRQEVEDLQILIDDLHQAFNEYWQGTLVMLFGSIVTGLGIKTSDVDCYLQVPNWIYPTQNPLVLQAKQILMRRNWIFQKLFAIINAKVPIVKFYHTPTERKCDISFTSYMGVQNSKLISYFLHLDERALKMAILVKYWSKVHNLTGTNLVPNYCLTMLVIFFLQQKHVVPSVLDLQKNVPELYINNWNAAYEEIDFATTNNESLHKLLGDFFKYYHKFEFDKFIISPFTGSVIDKQQFFTINTVPAEFELYKAVLRNHEHKQIRLEPFMCIQDPFEHNRNCSMSVNHKLAQKLLTHFTAAASIYENCDEKTFLQLLLQQVDEEKYSNEKRVIKKKKDVPKKVSNHGVRKMTRNFRLYYKTKLKQSNNRKYNN